MNPARQNIVSRLGSLRTDHGSGRPTPRWPRWAFRCCISITAVMVFNQAVFAGQFLAGSYDSLITHQTNAGLADIAMLVSALAAVLLRWPGRGPLWPAAACVGLFVLIGVQIGLGYGRELAMHVPLGVAVIGLTAVLADWAWRPHPAAVPAGPPSAATPGRPGGHAATTDDQRSKR
jgi:hypothetical protein